MAKNTTSATPSPEELLEKIKSELADIETSLETKKSELADVETSLEVKNSTNQEEIIEEFKFEGKKYAFSDDAPQVINFGGQKFTRKEITENEEILLQLIGGNSSLIKKL